MKTVDARGLACPLPVVRAKQALAEGGAVQVLVDNPIAAENLEKFAARRGYAACRTVFGADLAVTLDPGGAGAVPAPETEAAPAPPAPAAGGTVVVIASGEMGGGDPALGRTLLKAYLFALARQEQLPDALLCYNGGAFLTCDDSGSLEDLRALEKAGVEVLTCGTCLDFYGLKEKLAVGGVTNMYEIAERMARAEKLIRP